MSMSIPELLAAVASGKLKPEQAAESVASLFAAAQGDFKLSVSEKTGVIVIRDGGALLQAHVPVWRALLSSPTKIKSILDFCTENEGRAKLLRDANATAKKEGRSSEAVKPSAAPSVPADVDSVKASLLAQLQSLAPKA